MTRARITLTEPPADLKLFPTRRVTSRSLWRIHLEDRDARWFCSDGDCRFDLPAPQGTMYLAERELGAFVEVFRNLTLFAEDQISARRLSKIRVPVPMRLADCTSPRARGFGCTGEIHTTIDYDLTQRWANALAAAGFEGIRYLVRHDPSLTLAGLAVFGDEGVGKAWAEPDAVPLPERLLTEASSRYGIRAFPRP